MRDQWFCNDQDIVEEEKESILGSLVISSCNLQVTLSLHEC
jgi:hypothetical protein